MKSTSLLNDLIERTQRVRAGFAKFQKLSDKDLNFKVDTTSWSILECTEHLRRYGDFYLPEIEQRIAAGKQPASEYFKTGWLGNYFAKSMLPKEKLNKMKTFRVMNPSGSALEREVLVKFLNQQDILLELLERARTVDLTKTKTAISISNWVKLRLGDTFRVVVYHNERHLAQAEGVLQMIGQ